MPRINLDLDFLTHPKTVSISPLAQLLFIRSIIYSARHLTDGFIPAGAISHLTCDMQYDRSSQTVANGVANHATYGHEIESTDLIDELESVGWWVKITGGYDIHDFLEYQLSRRQVQQLSDKHKQSGKKGGLAKALANGKPTPSQTVANVYPLTNTNTNTNIKDNNSNRSRRKVADLTHEEWLHTLHTNPSYQGIDIPLQLELAKDWIAKHKPRVFTRRFFEVTWLKNAKNDIPITLPAKPRQVVL